MSLAQLPSDLENHLLDQTDARTGAQFFWHRARSRYVFKMLDKYFCRKVLDIGAGAGIFAQAFQDHYSKSSYQFVEPIASLEKKLEMNFGVGANRKNSSTWTDCEGFVLLDVLEHIADDRSFLKDILAKIPDKAPVIVTVPAFSFFWSEWDVKLGHHRRYTREELVQLVESCGFEVIDARYLFQSMVFPAIWRKFKGTSGSSEFPKLHPMMNQLFYTITVLEQMLLGWLPFGTSLALVARKAR